MCTQRPKHCVHMGIHLQEHRVWMYTHIPERCLPAYSYPRTLGVRICIHLQEHCLCVYTSKSIHVYTHPRTLYMNVCICTYQIIRRTCVYARTPEHCICTCTHCRLLFKLVYIHQSIVYSYVCTRVHTCTHTHFKRKDIFVHILVKSFF